MTKEPKVKEEPKMKKELKLNEEPKLKEQKLTLRGNMQSSKMKIKRKRKVGRINLLKSNSLGKTS